LVKEKEIGKVVKGTKGHMNVQRSFQRELHLVQIETPKGKEKNDKSPGRVTWTTQSLLESTKEENFRKGAISIIHKWRGRTDAQRAGWVLVGVSKL